MDYFFFFLGGGGGGGGEGYDGPLSNFCGGELLCINMAIQRQFTGDADSKVLGFQNCP